MLLYEDRALIHALLYTCTCIQHSKTDVYVLTLRRFRS
jgi:hypothetical protein